MKNIIETPNIALDYERTRADRDLGEYRITLYDKHGHYEDEFYLRGEQLQELVDGLKDLKIEVKKIYL